jgi:hypothetical protein
MYFCAIGMVRKIIKKITTVISYVLLIIFLMPLCLWGMLKIPSVQNYSVSKAMHWLSGTLGTEIRYSSVQILGFERIRIWDLFVADKRGDTLLYANKATAVLPVLMNILFEETSDKILLRKLELDKSTINFVIDSTSTINFQFILDFLNSGPPSTGKKSPQTIKNITIKDSRFVLRNETSGSDTSGIDFGNMQLTHFNMSVDNLIILGDTVNFDIDPLSFTEKSGFTINEMTTHMELCNSHMYFTDVAIHTSISSINAQHLDLNFTDFGDFSTPDLYEKILFDLEFDESEVNLTDLGYFADFFSKTPQSVSFSGSFSGPLSNFKGKDFMLRWGDVSRLSGDFRITDLPDIEKTFLIFTLKDLVSNPKDITSLNLPGNYRITLPSVFDKVENLKYQGNFTGFFNDFVSHGKLTTNLGVISTDLMLAPDSLQKVSFSGSVSTQNLDLGELIKNEDLFGDVSMQASVNGSLSKNDPLVATIQANVAMISFNKYPYQNLRIDGLLSNEKFKGKIKVDDPNLIMEFNGLVDMTSDNRKYDFSANVIDANLFALHLTDSDPEYHASFLLNANATGESLDNINGEVHLLNSLFSKANKQIQVFDFNVYARNSKELNEITIRSDLLDADISGNYNLSRLTNDLLRYADNYVPSLTADQEAEKNNGSQVQMNFDVSFKRTQPFFDFFFPDYLVSENSKLHGTFMPDKQNFLNLSFISPDVGYKSNRLKGLVLNVNSDDSSFIASLGCQTFSLGETINLDNFSLETTTRSDIINFKTRWLNWDSALYKGTIAGKVTLRGNWPDNSVLVNLDKSTITISDSLWNIDDFYFAIDSGGIGVNQLSLHHNDQFIVIDGKLSDTPGDSMHFSFDNFNLANVNFFTRSKDLIFAGSMNGNANMTGLKKQPLFFSSIKISDLNFNGQEFGNCSINSLWNNTKQSLSILAEAQRGKLTTLKFEGDYYPTLNGKMDFEISLDKLKTDIFNPFMEGIFSDIRGLVSGHLYLTGVSGKPTLSGNLKLQKNSFTIDYLKTRYYFTTEVDIVNNNFVLNDIQVFDQEGNSGIISGMIHTEYLSDISMNLTVNMHNLQCMNTKETDNSMFYGTAYASGTIKMKGSPSTLRFIIDASTGKDTRIKIPLTQSLEVSEYNFIRFEKSDTVKNETEVSVPEQSVSLAGMQMDFNLDVTPDAEIQIVFDPKIGDIIKARGSGKMKLSINTLGTFDMIGEYTIDKGDYLFTLQNLINKHLEIQPGSTMRWTGDPFNAKVDITAIYSTRASLSDLFSDPNLAQRVNVECRVFLTGSLLAPDIRYDIYLPYADEDTRSRVNGKITTEEELSKQFITLLVMNRFIPSQNSLGTSAESSGYLASSASSNAWELLSNQVNNWLSQSKLGVDLGFAYRTGENSASDEFEIAMSKEMANDRIIINGSLDMKTNAAAASEDKFAGDFDVEYKINKKGKLRLKAYNHSNDDISRSTRSPYTQGVGIFYKEEFDSFGELMKKYWASLSGKKKKSATDPNDQSTN